MHWLKYPNMPTLLCRSKRSTYFGNIKHSRIFIRASINSDVIMVLISFAFSEVLNQWVILMYYIIVMALHIVVPATI